MKLNELAKKMNDKFNNGQLDISNMDFTGALDDIDVADKVPYVDDNDLAYLDYIQQELDMMADIDDDEMIYSTGHFDEQLLDNYWSAQDEDGNYVHQIDVEIN